MKKVTREERLEAELYQAISTIEFLHGCLTDPIYKYSYPEQTLRHLERLHELLPERPWCLHSKTTKDCEGCVFGAEMRRRLQG